MLSTILFYSNNITRPVWIFGDGSATPQQRGTLSATTLTCKMYELWSITCHKKNVALCCLMCHKCWAISVLLLNTASRGDLSTGSCKQRSHPPQRQRLMSAVSNITAQRASIKKVNRSWRPVFKQLNFAFTKQLRERRSRPFFINGILSFFLFISKLYGRHAVSQQILLIFLTCTW